MQKKICFSVSSSLCRNSGGLVVETLAEVSDPLTAAMDGQVQITTCLPLNNLTNYSFY